jgi:hypothetical protein
MSFVDSLMLIIYVNNAIILQCFNIKTSHEHKIAMYFIYKINMPLYFNLINAYSMKQATYKDEKELKFIFRFRAKKP